VNQSLEVIDKMVGKRGGNYGLMGIVDMVMDQVRVLASYSGFADAAKVFTDTLSGVTGIITAMTPPPEYFSAQTDFINILDPTIGRSLSETVKGYMQVMTSQMDTIIGQIKKTIEFFAKIEVPDVKRAQTVSGLLNSIVSLMKAIMPDPNAVKAFSNITEDKGGIFTTAKKWQTLNVSGMTNFMESYSKRLQELVPVLSSGIITALVNATRDIKEERFKQIHGIGDTFKVIVDLLNAVGSISKSGDIRVENVQPGAVINIVKQAPVLSTMLTEVSSVLPALMGSMKAVVMSVPGDKKFAKDIESTKTLFGLLGDIVKMAQSMDEVTKAQAGVVGSGANSLINAVKQVGDFFTGIVMGDVLGGITFNIGILSGVITNLNGVLNTSVLADIKKAGTNIVTYAKDMTKIGSSFSSRGVTMALTAINEMITQANALNESLGKLPDLKLDAKLRTLATGMGLGGKFNYQIKSKEVVLNVTFNVEMNAADLEKSLILREKSVIRNRLNFATNEAPGKEAMESLPATPTNFAYAPAVAK
jgi:hypothetical protein